MSIQAKAPQAPPRGFNSLSNSGYYSSSSSMSGYSSMASSDLSRRLIYSIVDGDASDDFTVDYNTGVISVINSLDYEITPTYQLVNKDYYM